MIQEALVILACTKNSGCPETTDLYYKSHPEIKQVLMHDKKRAEQYVGPSAVILFPFIALAAGGKGTFNLNKYFSVQVSKSNADMIVFRYDF